MNAAAILVATTLLLAACQREEAGPAEAEPKGEASAASADVPAEAGAVPSTNDAAGNKKEESAAAPTAETPPEPGKPAPAANAAWSKSGYRLVGTEPFWGGTVKGTKILYQTPEDQEGTAVTATASYGPGGEVYTGKLDGKPFVLTLTKGPCSDGMSDKVHAYTAGLQVGGGIRQGCADPQ